MEALTKTRIIILILIFQGLTLGLSAYSLMLNVETNNNIVESMQALREPQLISFIKTEYENQEPYAFPLELRSVKIDINNNSYVSGWTFNLEMLDLIINETSNGEPLRYVYIEINFHEQDFNLYETLTCTYEIKGETGVIRKNNFEPSDLYYNFFTATEEIGRYYWQDPIPNEIRLEIKVSL